MMCREKCSFNIIYETAYITLNIVAENFRCTATIETVYWQSSEEAVEGSLPVTGPALESKAVYAGEPAGIL